MKVTILDLEDLKNNKTRGITLDLSDFDTYEAFADSINSFLAEAGHKNAGVRFEYEPIFSEVMDGLENPETVYTLEELLITHPEDQNAVVAYLKLYGTENISVKDFTNRYANAYEHPSDFAKEWFNDTYFVNDKPEAWHKYISYDRVAIELLVNRIDAVEVEGKYHIFYKD